MKRLFCALFMCLLFVSWGNCATYSKTKLFLLSINSQPQEAEVYLLKMGVLDNTPEGEVYLGKTPLETNIKVDYSYTITGSESQTQADTIYTLKIEKRGYAPVFESLNFSYDRPRDIFLEKNKFTFDLVKIDVNSLPASLKSFKGKLVSVSLKSNSFEGKQIYEDSSGKAPAGEAPPQIFYITDTTTFSSSSDITSLKSIDFEQLKNWDSESSKEPGFENYCFNSQYECFAQYYTDSNNRNIVLNIEVDICQSGIPKNSQ